jgi:hypothetical protein
MKLLNGAFEANLIKGKSGSSTWQFTSNINKIGKKPVQVGNLKEKPQFPLITEIEEAASSRFKEQSKQTVLDIAKYLKTL